MTVEEAKAKATDLGYNVGLAFEGYMEGDQMIPTVYHIDGYGVSLQLPDNDESAWESFVNDAAHSSRSMFMENYDAEAKGFDAPHSDRDIMSMQLTAEVEMGRIDQQGADESLAAFDKSREPVKG